MVGNCLDYGARLRIRPLPVNRGKISLLNACVGGVYRESCAAVQFIKRCPIPRPARHRLSSVPLAEGHHVAWYAIWPISLPGLDLLKDPDTSTSPSKSRATEVAPADDSGDAVVEALATGDVLPEDISRKCRRGRVGDAWRLCRVEG